MIRYIIWKLCSFFWVRLPPAAGYKLAALVADFTYLLWPSGRFWARQNMAQILGHRADPKTVDRLARQSLQNYCKYLVDYMRFPFLQPEEVKRKIRFEGWDNLDQAFRAGKGVILVGMHLGNWDLAAAAIALQYPLNVIAESFEWDKLTETVQQTRARLGLKVIPMEKAPRRVLTALRHNEMVALLIDQPEAQSKVNVRFFGGLAQVPAGAAVLALKTGARVLPGGAVRLPDGTFQGFIDGSVHFEATGDPDGDVQALTQRIVNSLEKWIRRYPDQWYMFRRLWVNGQCGNTSSSASAA